MDSLFLRRPIYSIGCALVAYGCIWQLNQWMRATTDLGYMWFIELGKYAVLFLLFRAYKIGVKEWLLFAITAAFFRLTIGLGPVTLATVFLIGRLVHSHSKA